MIYNYRVLLPFQPPSLECRHYGLVDRLVIRYHIKAEPASRALVVAGTALDAQVALALGFAVLVGNGINRAGCRTAAASHAETLIDDIGHQVAEARCRCAASSSLGRKGHEGFEECSCKILLFLGSLEEQVCHDRNVPDHL